MRTRAEGSPRVAPAPSRRACGVPLYLAGDAVSQHVNLSRLGAYMHLDYLGQRGFAAIRAKSGGWPWWKRGVWVGAAPLIPFVRLRRILRDLRRSGRSDELMPGILTRILPALAAGAVGEAAGHLFGAGATWRSIRSRRSSSATRS